MREKNFGPIDDKKLICDVANELLRIDKRFYIMFLLLVNTGQKLSEVLSWRIEDIRCMAQHEEIVVNASSAYQNIDKFYIPFISIKLSKSLCTILMKYTKTSGRKDEELAFVSDTESAAVVRRKFNRALHEVSGRFSLYDDINIIMMRKTFGYWYYNETKDIDTLSKIFGILTKEGVRKFLHIIEVAKDFEGMSVGLE